MSLDKKAQLLETAASTICGVRDLSKMLKWKTSKVILLLKKMNQEKLIEFHQVSHSRRGRPKKLITCTPLGLEFLETYRKLKTKPLKARSEDLKRAVKDALYTERLVANGHQPFKTFMELNTIVRNIKITSETPENT